MSMAQFDRLHHYLKNHSRLFPKLVPALKNLSGFVGHEDIKETVSKMVLYFIAQCSKQPRRSKRRRSSRIKKEAKRPRLFSCTSEEDDLDDGGEFDPETDSAKMALIALLTHTLQGGEGDSSDDEELEDPPFVLKCRERMNLLQGHFVHTLLLGKPGSGKTTFASLIVDVWDALGIIDKQRFKITKRSDWVGKYQGHSVAKAKKLIDSAKGGVIFIDEAYSIISSKDGDDMYGQEVLTEIVEAMSNPDKQVIFIMAGYEKEMKQLFSYNAGLERRFGYVYRFTTPAATVLESVFIKQMTECRWKVNKNCRQKLRDFFGHNSKNLRNGGGSTKQLLFHSQQNAVVRQFPNTGDNVLEMIDIEDGMKTFMQHAQVFTAPLPPTHMYL
jgi:adenylate kinase family enzyme